MLNAYSVGEKSQGWTPDKFFSYKPDHKYNQVPQYTGHKTWCLSGPALWEFK
jgi:hypothetical protein